MVLFLTSKKRNISFGCTFTQPTQIPVHKIGHIAPNWIHNKIIIQKNMFLTDLKYTLMIILSEFWYKSLVRNYTCTIQSTASV